MSRKVLIVSEMPGAEHCARAIAESAEAEVQVAGGRREALTALKHDAFDVVVLEESLAESDPVWAEDLWQAAGIAMQLQVSFAIAGGARLAREVRSALRRRDDEHEGARRAAAAELENELKSSVTGLLLESELALQEPSIPATLEPKLRHMMELAGAIRERLERSPKQPGPKLVRSGGGGAAHRVGW